MVGPAPFSWHLGGCARPAACPNVYLQQRDHRPWLVWDARIVDGLSCPTSCLAPFPPCSPSFAMALNLLSAPLTIPLVCCDINGFRRVSRGGEAMARRQKEERRVGSASRGMVRRWGCYSSRARHRVVPERARGPERCNASGAAVDLCSDAPANRVKIFITSVRK
jgi:hypothetical protein